MSIGRHGPKFAYGASAVDHCRVVLQCDRDAAHEGKAVRAEGSWQLCGGALYNTGSLATSLRNAIRL